MLLTIRYKEYVMGMFELIVGLFVGYLAYKLCSWIQKN